MHKQILIFILVLVSSTAQAVDLQEALENAYNTNSDMLSIRRKFLNDIEAFPQALASFLPIINAEHDTAVTNTKNKSQYNKAESNSKTVTQNLSVVQPIFNGGSSVASLKAAQSGFRAARSNYYSSEQKTILAAINGYLTYYSAKEKYDISAISVESNKKQLEAVEEKFKLGEATQTDIASARAGYAKAETGRLSAYADFQSARANFIRVFALEPTDLVVPNVPTGLPKSLQELQQKSIANNLDVESAKHSIVTSKASENVEKGKLLPQITFNVSGSRNFYDNETRFNGPFNNRGVTSTVRVQVPIFDKGGVEYSVIRQAKNQTRLNVIQLDSQIKINNANCITSWEQFNTSQSQIIAATQAVEAAEIAYNGTVQEEMVGSKTILDVLNAEDQLHQVRVAKVDAITANILAAYQIKSLIGQLTAKNLKLKVKYFIPENEFKKMKFKIIGF